MLKYLPFFFLLSKLFTENLFYENAKISIDEAYSPWKIEKRGEKIVYAKKLKMLYLMVLSIFSDSHEKELSKRLKESEKTLKNPSEEEKILLEKIASLQNKKGVFFKDIVKGPSKSWEISNFSKKSKKAPINTSYTPIPTKHSQTLSLYSRSIPLKIQFIGHSSFLIQLEGMNILTDPVFNDLYIFTIRCFKRKAPPGIDIKDLPKIDLILISHSHIDHMEKSSLLYLKRYNPTIIAPEGLGKWFKKRGFKKVFSLSDWDSITFNKKISIQAIPAIHNSGRRDEIRSSLSLGYVISSIQKKIYFSGDTIYKKDLLNEIKKRYDKIDIAILPLSHHLSLPQAIDISSYLKALLIPAHFGSYKMGNWRIDKKIERMDKKNIKILKAGEILD